MKNISLKVDKRGVSGKKVAALRKAGFVPSVIYGADMDPVMTQSALRETEKVVREAGRHTPISIVLGSKKHLAIIKTIDHEPTKHALRHVAFHAIKQNEKIVTQVPVVLIGMGESPAERTGLVVLQAIDTLEVRALPANLPEALEVSLEKLATAEDRLVIADIKLPEGVEFADHELDMELVVANVYEPSALEAANEAAGGDAEPEDVAEIEAEKGGDTDQDTQAGEDKPGGKGQKEPKESSVEAGKSV